MSLSFSSDVKKAKIVLLLSPLCHYSQLFFPCDSRDHSPINPHLPGIGQDFLIDSPLATPSPALQCERPKRRACGSTRRGLGCGLLLYAPYVARSWMRPIFTRSVVVRALGPPASLARSIACYTRRGHAAYCYTAHPWRGDAA